MRSKYNGPKNGPQPPSLKKKGGHCTCFAQKGVPPPTPYSRNTLRVATVWDTESAFGRLRGLGHAVSGKLRQKRPPIGPGGPYGTESQARTFAAHTSTIRKNANRPPILDSQGNLRNPQISLKIEKKADLYDLEVRDLDF